MHRSQERILNVGSSNIDFVMKMDRLPRTGESRTDATFVQTFGGKGANQALAAARAGGNVRFINCVGDDPYAPKMLRTMAESNTDVSLVQTIPGTMSGTALVMIGGDGNNYLSVAPGANYEITPSLLDGIPDLFEDVALVMLQYEIPVDSIQWMIEQANARQIPVMWNFAPARTFDLEWVGRVEYLVVNETEAEFLAGEPVVDVASATAVADTLLALGPNFVIITLGAEGSLVATGGTRKHSAGFQVEAVDATAAGDCFCGALAVALVEGRPLDAAVTFASAAAALCVSRLGAQPSLPAREEIETFLNAHA